MPLSQCSNARRMVSSVTVAASFCLAASSPASCSSTSIAVSILKCHAVSFMSESDQAGHFKYDKVCVNLSSPGASAGDRAIIRRIAFHNRNPLLSYFLSCAASCSVLLSPALIGCRRYVTVRLFCLIFSSSSPGSVRPWGQSRARGQPRRFRTRT